MIIEEVVSDRKWNDKKFEQKKLGQFSLEEEKLLLEKLKEFRVERNLTEEDLYEFLVEPKPAQKKGFWCYIAEVLPERSVKQVMNFCQRRFNQNNYKGSWTIEEEEELKRLINEIGPKWNKISKILERTQTNLKDKWKELGQNIQGQRQKNWTIEEMLQLIKQVEKFEGIKLVNISDEKDFVKKVKEEYKNQIKIRNLNSSKKYLKEAFLSILSIYEVKNIANLNLQINWTQISKFIPGKTPNDIKNKWYLLFTYQNKISTKEKHSLKKLMKCLKFHKVKYASEIDYSLIQNGLSEEENKILMKKLKKKFPKCQSLIELQIQVKKFLNLKKYQKGLRQNILYDEIKNATN